MIIIVPDIFGFFGLNNLIIGVIRLEDTNKKYDFKKIGLRIIFDLWSICEFSTFVKQSVPVGETVLSLNLKGRFVKQSQLNSTFL